MKTIGKKKSILAIGLIATVLLIGAGVTSYLKMPNNMIAIDINPSIELHTNRLNQVVSVIPVNEDAVQLMSGYQLEDRDLENVIEDIVDRMILSGYLIAGQENQILITANDTNTSDELLGQVNTAIATYLQEKQLQVGLLQQRIEISDADEVIAHENNVSAGKMAIIDKLLENNNNLTVEELASASIKELFQLSIDYNISLEDLIDNYSEVMENQFDLEDVLEAEDIDDADDAEVEDMQDEDDKSEAKNNYDEDQDKEDQDKEDQDEENQDEEDQDDNEDQDEDNDDLRPNDGKVDDSEDDQDNDSDIDEDTDHEDNEDSEEDDEDLYNSKDYEEKDTDGDDEDNTFEEYQDADNQEEDNQNEDDQDEDHDQEDGEDNDQGDED
jgi:hypothetical protein